MKRNFEYTAGSLALNFVDTVADRHGSTIELLDTPNQLNQWLLRADNRFGEISITSVDFLAEAIALREAIYDCLNAALSSNKLPGISLDLINKFSSLPDFRPNIKANRIMYTAPDAEAAILSSIAADAVMLLGEASLMKLRRCPECQMIFKDNSRPQKRVWCSSSSGCGNRAKVRRHRANKG